MPGADLRQTGKRIVAKELQVPPDVLEPATSRAPMRPLEMRIYAKEGADHDNTADVIIVGGGVIGCAAAYYLAKKGTSVIVLEQDESIGNGGSGRNGGGVRQSGRDPRELPLAMYAVEKMWPYLSDELGVNVEYHKEGNLRLGKTDRHLEILQGLTDRAAACGLEVHMIDGNEVREINPYLSEEVIGASWCPTDGHANPLITTLGYYRAARRLGVQFYTGESVKELRKVKGKLRKVITQKMFLKVRKSLWRQDMPPGGSRERSGSISP